MPNLNNNLQVPPTQETPRPDFSKIVERPRRTSFKKIAFLILKILLALIIAAVIFGAVLTVLYYNDLKQAYTLIFDARDKLQQAIHSATNRDFAGAATLMGQANTDFTAAKSDLDKAAIFYYIPYVGTQARAVSNVLLAGVKLTDSGQKVLLLVDDIVAPLKNESITFSTITPAQKKEILNKIVQSEAMLLGVQKEIDEATDAIVSIPDKGVVKPLADGIAPLKDALPKVRDLIDQSLPMLKAIPQIAGFNKQMTYLILLQNNYELRPTGGFIGTYGILKLQDGEIKELETDNIYNLDKSSQPILKEPSPLPIAKYLEQKYWSLRDINWAPDFPTTAQKALYMYDKENQILLDLKAQGKPILSEGNTVLSLSDLIPYEKNVDGVLAVTPEIIADLLKLTGPITVQGVTFDSQNLVDQLESVVGQEFRQQGIPASQRKEIIMLLANQLEVKAMALPTQKYADVLDIVTKSLLKKSVQIYFIDPSIEQLVLGRNWGGQVKSFDGDYFMVVDSNLASLKTDQYMARIINYSLSWKNNDLIAKISIVYKNNADFTWKSTRLRSYTRVYVPAGSQLVSSSGAMENDKIKDPAHTPGQVESSNEFGKAYFGAFISIEPHEVGTLTFEYKLPDNIKNQVNAGNYNLLIQKQAGVTPNLTLDLNFGKNIKSATPANQAGGLFASSYKESQALTQDSTFNINLQ
ncbi:MAG: DUF4012 domain-containing protein [Patescibacteria group bacterium]|nr:DUF4012 domain-containing protein [Patescibacteria group bacterium]